MPTKNDWAGKERRAHRRFPISVRVELTDKETFIFTRDLSRTGCFLACNPPPELGTVLRISIALPGVRQLLPVSGRVMRVQKEGAAGVGIEFIDVPEAFQLLLDEYLANLL